MDPSLAIRATGVGKRFAIGAAQRQENTLRDALASSGRRLWESVTRSDRRAAPEAFWALRDVSFDLKWGEVLGIIGRNGAGKSTLLKILSRITEPTLGEIGVRGRVGSLLEVGTGFHSELTGRENIFLNGAILGMSRQEIARKFDEIVDFAEVERFIDTPVKHYSSGMYLRLGFAVAAHLEPDVLIVDEVLAVGDAEFQKKCLGKMGSVAKEGRTVLFVSHNLTAIAALCDSGLVLEGGRVVARGSAEDCIRHYSASVGGTESSWSLPGGDAPDRALLVTRISSSLRGEQPSMELVLEIDLESQGSHAPAYVAVDILDSLANPIMQAVPTLRDVIHHADRSHRIGVSIELPPMIPGRYLASIWTGSHPAETLDEVGQAVSFEISASPTPGRVFPHTREHGYVVPPSRLWQRGPSSD
jgi:lipopolysaccharide transport system ATP-binding protein